MSNAEPESTEPQLPCTPRQPPPGWYMDGAGDTRWWDGLGWTAHLMPRPHADRTWAVLSHLSFLALPLIAAIVIRLTAAKDDPFVRHHATEALNAQILFTIIWNLILGPLIVISALNPDDPNPPVWLFVAIPGAILIDGLMFAFAIRGAIQASRGIWWRYPQPIRLMRGATPS
ncbi:DUF4870 domain-containing protein [Pedococcus sp. NPDC057267]|uniref:DUF4870 domain-containing protein n=1 Tax=Pedococcus sp. NPDC057267 TaxID=3346077 RepID=UPI00363D704A